MKKFFRILLCVVMHIAIAAGIIFIGIIADVICDDIVNSWSIHEPVIAYATATMIAIYWLHKGTKKLEAK